MLVSGETGSGSGSSGAGRVVAMLVSNAGYSDNRVRKEAEALVEYGYDVHVIGIVRSKEETGKREIGGVVYHGQLHPLRNGFMFSAGILCRSLWPALRKGDYTLITAAFIVMLAMGQSLLWLLPQLVLRVCRTALRRVRGVLKKLISLLRRFRRRLLNAVRRVYHSRRLGPISASSAIRQVLKNVLAGVRAAERFTRRFIGRQNRFFRWFAIERSRLIRNGSVLLAHLMFVELYASALKEVRPSVVHAHDLITLPAAAMWKKVHGGNLIYDAHELEMHRNVDYAGWLNYFRQGFEKRGIREADNIITVSECIAEHLSAVYGVPRPTVIFNTPASLVSRSQQTVRDVLSLDRETPLIVYVGSVTVNRGIENVVRALPFVPGFHFALVGPRNETIAQCVRELAAEKAVSDRLHFVDAVPAEDVPAFISGGDLSVLPIQNTCLSYDYCMPNKLFESVFAGLPVVVSNLTEMRRFVEATRVGQVADETDPEDLAEKIRLVYTDRDSYRKDREEVDALIRDYGWQAQKQKIFELYEAVLKLERQAA